MLIIVIICFICMRYYLLETRSVYNHIIKSLSLNQTKPHYKYMRLQVFAARAKRGLASRSIERGSCDPILLSLYITRSYSSFTTRPTRSDNNYNKYYGIPSLLW